MNRRNFMIALGLGITGLFIPKSNANTTKKTPTLETWKGYPTHFDYWHEFNNKIISVSFKENHIEERIKHKKLIYSDKDHASSDMVYWLQSEDMVYWLQSEYVCICKNRFGCNNIWLSRKDFAEQMGNIMKYEYPNRQIEKAMFGVADGYKVRFTYFTK